jgi:hypothetical protein
MPDNEESVQKKFVRPTTSPAAFPGDPEVWNRTMYQDFTLAGQWWLPDNPDEQIHGILKFEHEKAANLELNGNFSEAGLIDSGKPHFCDVIHGKSARGKRYTIFRAMRFQSRLTSGGFETSMYNCQYFLIGDHFAGHETAQFNEVSVRLIGLEASAGHIWRYSEELDSQSKLEWAEPFRFSAWVEELSAHVAVAHEDSISGIESPFVSARQKSFVAVKHINDQPLSWVIDAVFTIQRLFTLLYGFSCLALEVHVTHSNGGQSELYYSISKAMTAPVVAVEQILLPLSIFEKDEVERLLKAFVTLPAEMHPVITLYCATLNQPGTFTEFEFVNLMQSLEALHRAVYPNCNFMDSEDYALVAEPIIAAIPASLGLDHKRKLTTAISFGYQFSQRKRIKDLFRALPSAIRSLLCQKISRFADKLVDTRNRFTHWDHNDDKEIFAPAELSIINSGLRMVFQYMFLHLLSVDDEKIIWALRSMPAWRIYESRKNW